MLDRQHQNIESAHTGTTHKGLPAEKTGTGSPLNRPSRTPRRPNWSRDRTGLNTCADSSVSVSHPSANTKIAVHIKSIMCTFSINRRPTSRWHCTSSGYIRKMIVATLNGRRSRFVAVSEEAQIFEIFSVGNIIGVIEWREREARTRTHTHNTLNTHTHKHTRAQRSREH